MSGFGGLAARKKECQYRDENEHGSCLITVHICLSEFSRRSLDAGLRLALPSSPPGVFVQVRQDYSRISRLVRERWEKSKKTPGTSSLRRHFPDAGSEIMFTLASVSGELQHELSYTRNPLHGTQRHLQFAITRSAQLILAGFLSSQIAGLLYPCEIQAGG